jgi:hypothetical protein
MTVKVKRIDHGARRARELLRRGRLNLKVGVLQNEAQQGHPSGHTIGQIAVWMEYGGGIDEDSPPARSWLFDWLDVNYKIITKQLAADTARVIFGVPPESERKALSKRGGEYRRSIWMRIRNVPGDWEGLKEATIRKKGHSAPLIDTTTFINAIRWEVF